MTIDTQRKKAFHVLRSNYQTKMIMNDQNSVFPLKPTHPIEVLSNGNSLEEQQYT